MKPQSPTFLDLPVPSISEKARFGIVEKIASPACTDSFSDRPAEPHRSVGGRKSNRFEALTGRNLEKSPSLRFSWPPWEENWCSPYALELSRTNLQPKNKILCTSEVRLQFRHRITSGRWYARAQENISGKPNWSQPDVIGVLCFESN